MADKVKMNAQILYGIGDIRYTDADIPVTGDGEALIRITRCGICGSDIPRIYKTGAHNMPLIPGHEFTGVVERCVSRPGLVGSRVGIFPLIPCGKCPQCMDKHYEMCSNYNYMGSRCDGGFAEYLSAPVWNLLPVPDVVSDDDAAMLEPMGVAVHAIRQIGLLEKGMSGLNAEISSIARKYSDPSKSPNIVICGLGTIGLLVALFVKDAGYRNVFCLGNKDLQKEKLMEMGYEDRQFCDTRTMDPEEYIKERTGGRGADYYFECIGKSENYAQAIRCAAPLGNVMLVGNPASDMELKREDYWKILRKQLTLKGTWNSSFYGLEAHEGEGVYDQDDWAYAISRLEAWSRLREEGKRAMLPSDLITHRYNLKDMQKGLEIMRDKSEEYVKVMVEVGRSE